MQRRSSGSVKVFYPDFDAATLIRRLRESLPALAQLLPLRLVVLFGSYAKDRYTVAGDVDLLVVYAGGRRQDDYALVKKALRIPRLEPHIYTETEYRDMRDANRHLAYTVLRSNVSPSMEKGTQCGESLILTTLTRCPGRFRRFGLGTDWR